MSNEDNLGGRPPIWDSPEELQRDIDRYFETDAKVIIGYDDGNPIYAFQPTMSGLALSLGVDRKTITNYANKDGFFPAIKKARDMVENALERHLYGKNVTGAIFNLKNNFGWTDKQELDLRSADGSMTPKASIDTSKLSIDTLKELMAAKPNDTE